MTMIQELTIAEEAQLILLDVFNEDEIAQNYCINLLCEQEQIVVCPENQDQINELIVEFEDELHSIYKFYSNEPL